MSSLKVFEIAGSIAGLAGISLVVFYFLFMTIIQKALPSLTKNSQRNIIILMLFMVWSVTITAMTSWIYGNTKQDGGVQPKIEEENIVKKPSSEISAYEGGLKVSMYSSSMVNREVAAAPALKLTKNENHFEFLNTDTDGVCGLKVRSSLWLSFNEGQPYYIDFQDKKVKVSLKSIDIEENKAAFLMELQEEGKPLKIHDFTLVQNEFYAFKYNDCTYRFAYRGKTSWITGIEYWFKTRYAAHFSIEPLE